MTNKTIVFVLGMHRSGTSLATKALTSIGVEIGVNLLPPAADNPTGFFEDIEVFQLNERILETYRLSWDTPTAYPISAVDIALSDRFSLEAEDILRALPASSPIIAVKDPRFCTTIGIWVQAALRLELVPRFIVCYRDPVAVASSILKRNGLPLAQGLSLWRNSNYQILAFLCENNIEPVIVDYRDLVSDPIGQLSRISSLLFGSDVTPNFEQSIKEFAESFVDTSLCHHSSSASRNLPADIKIHGLEALSGLFNSLSRGAWDRAKALSVLGSIDLGRIEAENYFSQRASQAAENAAQLRNHERSLELALAEKERSIAARLEESISSLNRAHASEMSKIVNQHGSELLQLATIHNETILSFENSHARERERAVQEREAAEKAHQEAIRTLAGAQEKEIRALEQDFSRASSRLEEAHRRNMIAATNRVGELEAERGRIIFDLHRKDQEVIAIRHSLSWRLSAPIRFLIGGLLYIRNIGVRDYCASFAPLSGTVYHGQDAYTASNEDPQFLLTLRCTPLPRGYYTISVDGQGLESPEVYIDFGDGFSAAQRFPLRFDGDQWSCSVSQQRRIVQIRFDPSVAPGKFRLRRIEVRRLSRASLLLRALRTIYRRESAAGKSLWDMVRERWQIARRLGLLHTFLHFEHYTPELSAPTPSEGKLGYLDWIRRVEAPWLQALPSPMTEFLGHRYVVAGITTDTTHLLATIKSIVQQSIAPNSIWLIESAPFDLSPIQTQLPDTAFTVIRSRTELSSALSEHGLSHLSFVNAGTVLGKGFSIALASHLAHTFKDCRAIYADHDLIDENGERHSPSFKPDWSPDCFLEHDYIGPVGTFSAISVTEALGCVPPDTLDLPWAIFAYIAAMHPDWRIGHIPFVLSHQREPVPNTAPKERDTILNDLLRPASLSVTPTSLVEVFRLSPIADLREPLVSIIIPTKDKVDILRICISSLLHYTTYQNFELLIVDNQSREPETQSYYEEIRGIPNVRLLEWHHPFNYSAINNYAAKHANGELLCFLNNDIEVISEDWLSELVALLVFRKAGAVGVKLLYPDHTVQHGGVIIGLGGVAGHPFTGLPHNDPGPHYRLSSLQNYSAVTAACMLTPARLFHSLGGFDERHLPVAFNDVDYCLRIRESGERIVWTPHVTLIHHESATRGADVKRGAQFTEEIRYMQTRWSTWIERDPAYNPHLSLLERPFELSSRWIDAKAPLAAQLGGREVLPYAFQDNLSRIKEILSFKPLYCGTTEYTCGLSIVILNLDMPELIIPLLDSLVEAQRYLQSTSGLALEIIVGDTGSTNPAVLAHYDRLAGSIQLHSGMRYQFSACNNDLFSAHVTHDHVLFLNNDIIFSDAKQQLGMMFDIAQRSPEIGVFGTRLHYPDGRLQHGGIDIFRNGQHKGLCYHPGHGEPQGPSRQSIGDRSIWPAVTGACLLMRSELFRRCNGFDVNYRSEAQDVDLCLKAHRLGLPAVLLELGHVVHIENATRPKGEEDNFDRARFIRRWGLYFEYFF